ncbi:MAG: deoxyribonuclease IV [Spirochaetes bacterium]|nr:deoxyribonuclease IV [Spirochaetota bacterium]
MKHTGFHVSIQGGLHKSFDNALLIGIDTFQIFLKNSTRWTVPPLTDDEVSMFSKKWNASPSVSIHAHTGYLINLAGSGENLEKSINLLRDEMERADLLDIPTLVLHPGSHIGDGIETGIERIASNINSILDGKDWKVTVLLETTAGQGNSVGHRFEHIRDIMASVKRREKLGVCFDTCHAFAAGYDISNAESYTATFAEFDRIIGLNHLKLFHVNDSKKICGSRVDRHEHIGQGEIGPEAFRLLFTDKRFIDIDKILETPVDDVRDDRDNLEYVEQLAAERATA